MFCNGLLILPKNGPIPIYKPITIFLLILALCNTGLAQNRTVSGIVQDSLTHAPLSHVSVTADNMPGGLLTHADGSFKIGILNHTKKLLFTATGYRPFTLTLPTPPDTSGHPLRVLLSKSYTELKGVVVTGKRGKYRNKNNPAVELIRKVIENKPANGPGYAPYSSFEQYEKIRLLFDQLPHVVVDNKVLKKFHFLFENADTVLVPGKKLVPVYLEEVVSANYYRKHPEKKKKVVLARKSVDFGEYVDMRGVSAMLNRLYEDINLYDNSIDVFTMQFVSPIADLAPSFYMYFIRDTVVEDGVKLVQLYFTPRNPEDLLFRGNLWVTLDGHYAIRRVELEVSKHINMNWVRDFRVRQDFEQGPGEHYHLANSDMVGFFSPLPKSRGVFGERTVSISHVTDSLMSDTLFSGLPVDTALQASRLPAGFWEEGRPVALSVSEAKTYANTDSLLKMPAYHRMMDFATVFSAGFKSAGKFDIGPIGNFYSFNPVEGQKLRFGGRSNSKLSHRYYTEDYIGYGLKDTRVKYFLSGTYSINNRNIYSYPFHYIQGSFLHDGRRPGQETVFSQGNSALSSFNRGNNTGLLYNDILRLSYIHEFGNHLSYILGMKYWDQHPAGSLYYIFAPVPGQPDTVDQITSTELSATLRWAPHEQFFEGKGGRSNIINKYPIISFQYSKGIKGFFGGEYNYNNFHLKVYKRCYLSPLGFSDITLDAGWLAGNLPFPLLIIHPANQSYYYVENAYNLMNVEEFVSDHYAGVNIDHFFNGFFFNKIPLVKQLRLREVIAAKLLYGGLRDENNPALNPAQMKFPLNAKGMDATYSLGSKPYVEASVGVYNIFSIFRLDLVKRFTYLDHPDISKLGLRVSSNFNF